MSSSVHLVDPDTGAVLLAGASLQNCYLVIATQIFPVAIDRAEVQHTLALKNPRVFNAQSYAIGLHMITNATAGQIHDVVVRGNPRSDSSLKTT